MCTNNKPEHPSQKFSPHSQIGDLIGLNTTYQKNEDSLDKVGNFFGQMGDKTRKVYAIVQKNSGWYYVFEGGRIYPVEWFDETKSINWGRLRKILIIVITGVFIPVLAAVIQTWGKDLLALITQP